jgi:ABC-type phosphate transport system substrate-binding protein
MPASLTSAREAIGYIECGYAKSQKVSMAVLENKARKFVAAPRFQADLSRPCLPP